MNYALILAGGIGNRMDMGTMPKQYLMVRNRPIIDYCLTTFQNHPMIDGIVIVAEKNWHSFLNTWIENSAINKFIGYALPGHTRQFSIYNGLTYLSQVARETDGVIIHDAARPLIGSKLISDCLLPLAHSHGVMPVLPIKDTCYQSLDGKSISNFIPRSQLFAGQAPESFRLGPYLDLHKSLSDQELEQISGSSELAYKYGLNVAMVEGCETNIKITTQNDLQLFETYLDSGDAI